MPFRFIVIMYSASRVAQTAPGLAGIVQSTTSQYLKPSRVQWAEQKSQRELSTEIHRNPIEANISPEPEEINYQEEDLLGQTAVAAQQEKNIEQATKPRQSRKKPTPRASSTVTKRKRKPTAKKQTVRGIKSRAIAKKKPTQKKQIKKGRR